MADFVVPPSTPIPKPRPLHIRKMVSIETILFDLRHHKSFITPLANLSDPYIQSMQTFQTFTTSLIQSLEAKNPAVVELAQNDTLQDLYSDFPSFYEQDTFREWVKDGTLKHPQRQTEAQCRYLRIVELQAREEPGMGVGEIVKSAITAGQEWRETAYTPANLVQDRDALQFFTCALSGLEKASLPSSPSSTCPICTSPFDSTTHIPKQLPCTHNFCTPCLTTWLQKSSQAYTCPLCRSCIPCGRNPCTYHPIPQESSLPMPLPEIMDVVLVDRIGGMDVRGAQLHGMAPDRYWVLREETRRDRVGLRAAREVLGSGVLVGEGNEGVRRFMEGVEREAAERIRGDVLHAVAGIRRLEVQLAW